MTTRRVISLAVGLLAATLAAASEWPQFRGPNGSAVAEESELPTKWSKSSGLRYQVALPGRGLSNPVIAGGRVYVTACSGYRERRLHVLCFDEATGQQRWQRQLAATGSTICNPTTCMAAPTPATDGQAVYALFATGDLAALDRDGRLLWYRSLVSDYPDITNQVGMASSPVLVGGVLVVPMDNAGDSFVAGIDTATGKNRWRAKRPREINWASPIAFTSAGKPAVLVVGPKEMTAYDPESGKVRWSATDGKLTSIPSPAAGEGLLFLPGGPSRALRPRQDGSEPEAAWEGPPLAGGYASPVYHAGRVYGLTGAAVVCVHAADGKERWRQRAEGPFDASPVIADGKLYAVNRKGRTFVVQLGDPGKLIARNDLDDTILATPAIANGCLYLRSDKYLYCIGPGGK